VAQDPYVSPGTHTLRNRYGVRDPAALSRLEATFTAGRLAELGERPIAGVMTLPTCRRCTATSSATSMPGRGTSAASRSPKATCSRCPSKSSTYLGGVLAQLPGEQHLRGLDREAFIDRPTHYLAEINATHPFREGNGRTQRAFVQQLAQDAGYRIDWRTLDPEQNIDASRAAPRRQPAATSTARHAHHHARARRDRTPALGRVPAAGPLHDTSALLSGPPRANARNPTVCICRRPL
jgi:cell filamentation protein